MNSHGPTTFFILRRFLFFPPALLLLLACTFCRNHPEKKDVSTQHDFVLALIQMEVTGGELMKNLDRASDRVALAARAGARLVLLPEMMDLGWTHPSARTLAGQIPEGSTSRILASLAKKHSIYLCAGIAERDGDSLYNSAILIGPDGELLLKHRKLNELDIAHDLYAQGDRLNVARTPLGSIGVLICADASAAGNVLSKSLGYMGADIILSPCSWAVPPGFDNRCTPYGEPWLSSYAEVSRMFSLWIAGVSNVGKIEAGPWNGWDCIGNSLVFGPGGEKKLQAPFGMSADTILYLNIELKNRPARGTRWYEFWNRQDIK